MSMSDISEISLANKRRLTILESQQQQDELTAGAGNPPEGTLSVIDGIVYVNNKPLTIRPLLPVKLYNLEELDLNLLQTIFKDDVVWFVDQSPTLQVDGTGSTLYMCKKGGVIEKKLSNAFMKQTPNGNSNTFKKLHWLAKPDTYLSYADTVKDIVVGCWVGSGVTTLFDSTGKVLDNYSDETDIANGFTMTHAAYFIELDTAIYSRDGNYCARVLISNMSNATLISVGITKDKKFDTDNILRFNIIDYVHTLDDSIKSLFVDTIKPITARHILSIPLDSVLYKKTNFAAVTLSGGGHLIVEYSSTEITAKKLYTPRELPNAGLLSYSVKLNDEYFLFLNNGVGTGSTTSNTHTALYKIGYSHDEATDTVIFKDEPEIMFRKNSGDGHGMIAPSADTLVVVGRDLNKLYTVNMKESVVKEHIVHNLTDRDIALDLIDVGDGYYDIEFGEKYKHLYASNRGAIPVSGNNPSIRNAVGTQAGLSVIKYIDGTTTVDLKYILNISNIKDDDDTMNIADVHAVLVL